LIFEISKRQLCDSLLKIKVGLNHRLSDGSNAPLTTKPGFLQSNAQKPIFLQAEPFQKSNELP